MKSGQFVRGKIDGIQKRFTSSNVFSMLPKEKRQELENYTEIGEHPRFFKTELVLTKTVITEADNTDGRPNGIINHTVMYQFDPAITHETVQYIFDLDTFIEEVLAGKRKFKMPLMPALPDADSGLIDSPPPIEWEVEQ